MSGSTRALTDPPGSTLVWLFLVLEAGTFAIVFGVIARTRAGAPGDFSTWQAALSPALGFALTAILITSGLAAALGVRAWRAGRNGLARLGFGSAAALGLGFLALKAHDFGALARDGHRLGTSDLWDVYFLATGFHAVHVVFGVAWLLRTAVVLGRRTFDDPEAAVAGAALFWHFCDVAWFFLFPLFFARS